ncbi:unnamed protein product [Acanthoscelides obtectus]|uniref:Uncharacterized protein n=1 Tax=Acanthoscelides obtectus TaxID=200917 RepID=A0A9P0JYU7_ACAOB|nr:unnamed protein product [Acanthoscelides obtectus]CAK1633840.1 hypothetical protein AOBTE_LOCUS8427 [Acanthoscelides obtectus]
MNPAVVVLLSGMVVLAQGMIVDPVTAPIAVTGSFRGPFEIEKFNRCFGGVCIPDALSCIGGDCDMLTGDVIKKALFVDVARKLQKAKLLEQMNAEINLDTDKGLWYTIDSTRDKVCGPRGCVFTGNPIIKSLIGGAF